MDNKINPFTNIALGTSALNAINSEFNSVFKAANENIKEEDFDFIDKIKDKLDPIENITKKKEDTNELNLSMDDFFEQSKSEYDDFDSYCYKKGDGYKIPAFPDIESYLEGVESGLYVLAAESNCG